MSRAKRSVWLVTAGNLREIQIVPISLPPFFKPLEEKSLAIKTFVEKNFVKDVLKWLPNKMPDPRFNKHSSYFLDDVISFCVFLWIGKSSI